MLIEVLLNWKIYQKSHSLDIETAGFSWLIVPVCFLFSFKLITESFPQSLVCLVKQTVNVFPPFQQWRFRIASKLPNQKWAAFHLPMEGRSLFKANDADQSSSSGRS
ncbi:hypothetical protein [Angelakisella massiliensis]|uniref:hypothetical protein n=1 Tax=Angelakisella massiliensis TaxID=1871018 RepID=UPI0024B175F3|nr:hypothetical protein [Angelakisella massiliensis]